jgi:Dolichyl-phosphate-mannose-protein mannosyltransferase
MMRLAMRRLSPGVLAAVLALAVVLRVGVVANRHIDPDESQHLHVAWLLSQGQIPYRDFWEHHLPFFHYAMAPVTMALAERPAVYFGARVLMAALAGLTVWLTWLLTRRLSVDGAVWAAIVLVFLPQFAETSTETRPDVPALVAHLLSLVALVRWRYTERPGWLWTAGAWQGVALALTLKAAFGLPGVLLAVMAAPTTGPGAAWWRRAESIVRLVTGMALSLGALLCGLWAIGGMSALQGLYEDVIRSSMGFVDFGKTRPAFGSEVGVFIAAGLGLLLVVRVRGLGVLRHPVHSVLILPAASIAIALQLPRTPAVYQHAWLPVLPVVAVYAGLALTTLAEWARQSLTPWRRGLWALAIGVAVLVPAGETLIFAVRDQNAADLQLMRSELRLACRGEAVLDGTGLYVFRPAAYRQGALIRGVREWVARGVISEQDLADEIREARAPVAHPDFRILGMIGPVADVLRRHYVAGPDGLLVAGAEITVEEGTGRFVVDLLAPGLYLLSFGSGLTVAIDGIVVRTGWHPLPRGPMELTWYGSGGTIRLTLATCQERQDLGARRS